MDGVSTLLGCASHAVPSDLRVMAGQIRECHAEGAWLTRAELLDITPEVCSEYREACDCDTVIELETYGEGPEPLLLRWNVSAPFGEMFERLRSLSVWYGEEEAIDDEAGPDGVPRLLMSWYEPPPPADPRTAMRLPFCTSMTAISRLMLRRAASPSA
jgi:hypothetical protein